TPDERHARHGQAQQTGTQLAFRHLHVVALPSELSPSAHALLKRYAVVIRAPDKWPSGGCIEKHLGQFTGMTKSFFSNHNS
ncbi:hypothetical protein, partial [Bradyrhizobium sp.]|uniref:hypothetical protein n=1 Tax=Bradyrhizobium sp. TaxID=376 RepID=UPI0029022147